MCVCCLLLLLCVCLLSCARQASVEIAIASDPDRFVVADVKWTGGTEQMLDAVQQFLSGVCGDGSRSGMGDDTTAAAAVAAAAAADVGQHGEQQRGTHARRVPDPVVLGDPFASLTVNPLPLLAPTPAMHNQPDLQLAEPKVRHHPSPTRRNPTPPTPPLPPPHTHHPLPTTHHPTTHLQ